MLLKEQGKSLICPRPQSFAALMEMYEINYIQLRMLLGDLAYLPDYVVAHGDDLAVPVLLQIEERTAHTTTLLLTYLFSDEQDDAGSRPDLQVRVYHDAQQVEVVRHALRRYPLRLHTAGDGVLINKWRINRFLYKWVTHLRRYHYRFQV